MKKRKTSFSVQIMIMTAFLMLAANTVIGMSLVNKSSASIKILINNRMLDIANTAADMLDGDILGALRAEDKGTEKYGKINDTLAVFQNNIDLKYIYCVRDMGDKQFTFTVDPTVADPGEFGEPVVYTDALYTASQGTAAVDDLPYTDEWGHFYSAYSPVFDSNGKVAGIVAVDFDADWYEEQISDQRRSIIVNSLLSIIVGVLLIILSTGRIRRKLRVMTDDIYELAKSVDDLKRELDPENAADPGNVYISEDVSSISEKLGTVKDELRVYVDTVNSVSRKMITALSSDYRGVYYIDLDSGEGVCYQPHSELFNGLKEGESFPYLKAVEEYAAKYVTEEYKEDFLKFIDSDNIRTALENERVITFRYMINRGGHETYEMIKAASVRPPEKRDDHIVHAVVAGFSDVDAETRSNLNQSKALSDALAAAERANRAKTVFLNNMSHDIRTPMNAIIGFTSLAGEHIDNTALVRDYLDMITVSSQHLLALINDVLDMSRIESGKVTINPERVHLPFVIHELRTIMSSNAAAKHLKLFTDIRDVVHEDIMTDKLRLDQVLLNILSNAVKFTPDGGTVRLRLTEIPSSDEGVTGFEFRITDTGIGMSAEFKETIFEAFTREHTSTVSGIQGTGLGMAITKNIVDMMGGSITVNSEEGKGSEFIVYIPCRICDDASETEPLCGFEGARALVEDSDNEDGLSVCSMLRRLGMRPELAQDGKEALLLAEKAQDGGDPFKVFITDSLLSDENSMETARFIRKTAGDGGAVVIFISDDRTEADHEPADPVTDAFCSKPLFMSELRAALSGSSERREEFETDESSEQESDFTGKRLLLAEDNEMNRIIATEILENLGFETDIAVNGEEAVRMINEADTGYYDIVLMDMQMPVMDGCEATRRIRALDNKEKASVPIVAVTANAFEEDKQIAYEAGMNGHLAKPYDIPQIIKMLAKLLNAK